MKQSAAKIVSGFRHLYPPSSDMLSVQLYNYMLLFSYLTLKWFKSTMQMLYNFLIHINFTVEYCQLLLLIEKIYIYLCHDISQLTYVFENTSMDIQMCNIDRINCSKDISLDLHFAVNTICHAVGMPVFSSYREL